RGLAEQLDMQAMYDLVGDRIRAIFDAQIVDIGIHDPETDLVHFPYTVERGGRSPDEPVPLRSARRLVVETGKSRRVSKAEIDADIASGKAAVVQGEVPQSVLLAPLTFGSRVGGGVGLQKIDRDGGLSADGSGVR